MFVNKHKAYPWCFAWITCFNDQGVYNWNKSLKIGRIVLEIWFHFWLTRKKRSTWVHGFSKLISNLKYYYIQLTNSAVFFMRYGPSSDWPPSKGQHEVMIFQSLFVIPKESKTEKKIENGLYSTWDMVPLPVRPVVKVNMGSRVFKINNYV